MFEMGIVYKEIDYVMMRHKMFAMFANLSGGGTFYVSKMWVTKTNT